MPPWIGALDVLILAGDDPGDPALVSAAATGVRRGARVAVVAPYEGPLRDATAGRSVVAGTRLWVRDDFGLARYLAAGLAVLQVVDPGLRVDLAALADELDAEAFRNSAGRELFTNPAKTLAERMSGRDVVLAGDNAAHAGAGPPRRGGRCCGSHTRRWPRSDWPTRSWRCTPVWVANPAPIAKRRYSMTSRSTVRCRERVRTFVLATDAERPVVVARVSGLDDVDVINAEDVPELSDMPEAPVAPVAGRPGTTTGDAGRAVGDDGHLPATGSRLSECTCYEERCGPMHGVREPRLPISPDGQVPQRIPRRSCGSGPTRAIRRGWRPTRASGRCSTRCETIRRVSWAPPFAAASATTLPFLVKVLAADEPLSLQAHPSAEQAVEGFAREEKLGIPCHGAHA